jgi:hypothetical protein
VTLELTIVTRSLEAARADAPKRSAVTIPKPTAALCFRNFLRLTADLVRFIEFLALSRLSHSGPFSFTIKQIHTAIESINIYSHWTRRGKQNLV